MTHMKIIVSQTQT